MRKLLFVLLALAVGGCAAKLVPDDYTGPVAVVADSSSNFVGGHILKADKIDFFFLAEVDGKTINNNLSQTSASYQGQGLHFRPISHERKVPAKRMKVKIVGQTYYGAPIGALLGKTYRVSGMIDFEPKHGARYVVKGRLGEGNSAVWIERSTGSRVTAKIEKKK